jgi:hypothetical protein
VIQVNLLGNEPGGSGISRGTATTSAQREWAQIAVSRSRLNLAIPPQLPNASGTSANTRNDRAAEQAVGLCAHFMDKQKLGKHRAEKVIVSAFCFFQGKLPPLVVCRGFRQNHSRRLRSHPQPVMSTPLTTDYRLPTTGYLPLAPRYCLLP